MNKQVNETIETAIEYIKKLKTGIMNSVEFFQKYEESKGTEILIQITDGLQWLMDALVLVQKLDNEKVLEINKELNEIVGALKNEDYILVGDLLQYELLPLIEEIESGLL